MEDQLSLVRDQWTSSPCFQTALKLRGKSSGKSSSRSRSTEGVRGEGGREGKELQWRRVLPSFLPPSSTLREGRHLLKNRKTDSSSSLFFPLFPFRSPSFQPLRQTSIQHHSKLKSTQPLSFLLLLQPLRSPQPTGIQALPLDLLPCVSRRLCYERSFSFGVGGCSRRCWRGGRSRRRKESA